MSPCTARFRKTITGGRGEGASEREDSEPETRVSAPRPVFLRLLVALGWGGDGSKGSVSDTNWREVVRPPGPPSAQPYAEAGGQLRGGTVPPQGSPPPPAPPPQLAGSAARRSSGKMTQINPTSWCLIQGRLSKCEKCLRLWTVPECRPQSVRGGLAPAPAPHLRTTHHPRGPTRMQAREKGPSTWPACLPSTAWRARGDGHPCSRDRRPEAPPPPPGKSQKQVSPLL